MTYQFNLKRRYKKVNAMSGQVCFPKIPAALPP